MTRTIIRRRASVHTANDDGVSMPLTGIDEEPAPKRLGTHNTHFRRRASLAHVDVSASPQDTSRLLKRRGSTSHGIDRIASGGADLERVKSSHLNARVGLPKLSSPPRSPGESAVKLVPKMKGKKKHSTPSSPVSRQDHENVHQEKSDERERGWATKSSVKKRQERLQTLLGKQGQELSPELRRRELLSPLAGQRPLPKKPADIEVINLEDHSDWGGDDSLHRVSLDIACGEDLSEQHDDVLLPSPNPLSEQGAPSSSTPKFDSMKKSVSHPLLLPSRSSDAESQESTPRRARLSGLEKTLHQLKDDLNSEAFRASYQKMVSRPRSARSSRILNLFPDYVRQQNEEILAQTRLQVTRNAIRETLERSRNAMEISSSLLVKHFKDVPTCELSAYISCFFDAYDVNKNNLLEVNEVQMALRELGKVCSVEDVREFFRKVGATEDSIDRQLFEEMVRSFQGWDHGWNHQTMRQQTTSPRRAVNVSPALSVPRRRPLVEA